MSVCRRKIALTTILILRERILCAKETASWADGPRIPRVMVAFVSGRKPSCNASTEWWEPVPCGAGGDAVLSLLLEPMETGRTRCSPIQRHGGRGRRRWRQTEGIRARVLGRRVESAWTVSLENGCLGAIAMAPRGSGSEDCDSKLRE